MLILRNFALFSALVSLWLAGAQIAIAQEKAVPAKDTVLFDFESGSYDGWTLSGDCWDKAPATPKTFVDRQGNSLVSGIVGNGYLTTLYKSAATTGKAVSKDFTIDKPFLTFRIGGGNYPKEACLNLVVDGKVVRSETGTDSAELRPAYWDVSLLMGKIAHLEIVDTTQNPNRGYVMLDDLCLTETLNTPEQKMLIAMAENWRQKYRLPGVWCAYIKDGKIAACVAIGLKNKEAGTPALISDHLNIGSVSKVITGTMVAQFVARGVLRYETTVGEVFPELASKYVGSPLLQATLAHLLVHEGGLPHDIDYSEKSAAGGVAWRYEILKRALTAKGLKTPGPASYEYSNLGAIVEIAMIERLAKTTLDDILHSSVGTAIGLSSPKMLDWSRLPKGDEVSTYQLVGDQVSFSPPLGTTGEKYSPAGAYSLTLPDLCAFCEATLRNSLQLPVKIYAGTLNPFDVASGQSLASWKCGNIWLNMAGFTGRGEWCDIAIRPEKNRALVFYTNACYPHKPKDGEFDYRVPLFKEFSQLLMGR